MRISAGTGTSIEITDEDTACFIVDQLVTTLCSHTGQAQRGTKTSEQTAISLNELIPAAPLPPPLDFTGVWPKAILEGDRGEENTACFKSVLDYFAGKDANPNITASGTAIDTGATDTQKSNAETVGTGDLKMHERDMEKQLQVKDTQTAATLASTYELRIEELEKRMGLFEAGQTTRIEQLENRIEEFESSYESKFLSMTATTQTAVTQASTYESTMEELEKRVVFKPGKLRKRCNLKTKSRNSSHGMTPEPTT